MALKINDIVWAKMKGFPYWPASIADDSKMEVKPKATDKIFVYFFGTDKYAYVKKREVVPFSMSNFKLVLQNRSPGFRKAVHHLFDYCLEIGDTSVTDILNEMGFAPVTRLSIDQQDAASAAIDSQTRPGPDISSLQAGLSDVDGGPAAVVVHEIVDNILNKLSDTDDPMRKGDGHDIDGKSDEDADSTASSYSDLSDEDPTYHPPRRGIMSSTSSSSTDSSSFSAFEADDVLDLAESTQVGAQDSLAEANSTTPTACESSADRIEPSRINSSPKRTRKRKRNPSSWKRNVLKDAVQKGHAHVTPKGEIVPGKQPALGVNLCGAKECRKKCNSRMTAELRRMVHRHFYEELGKNGKRRFLYSSQRPVAVKRRRPGVPDARKRKSSWNSVVTIGGSDFEICLQALATLLSVGQTNIKNVRSSTAERGAAGPSAHGSGSHHNRPNRVSDDIRQLIINHITKFPAESSHYSRASNPHRRYLGASLSIAKMYHMFLEENKEISRKVTEHYYRDTFSEEFNLGFGSPRTDTCSICEVGGTNSTEHQRRAAGAMEQMKADRSAAAAGGCLYITFDLQKTLPLPKLSVSDAFYLRQLWLYNLGIHAVDGATGAEGLGYMFTWTENQFGRGCSEVASSILAFSEVSRHGGCKHLVAWSDSCAGQNKNFYIIGLWQYLVKTGRFTTIDHKFPEVGHSRLDSDRDFAHIELAVRKHEKILLPDQYRSILTGCQRKNPFTVLDIANGMIDLKRLTTRLNLVKRTKNTANEKVSFKSEVRWIRVENFGEYKYKHSFDDEEAWKLVNILKKRDSTTDCTPEDVIASVAAIPGRPIKKEKFRDIQKQLKFIDRYALGFYHSLESGDVEESEGSA